LTDHPPLTPNVTATLIEEHVERYVRLVRVCRQFLDAWEARPCQDAPSPLVLLLERMRAELPREPHEDGREVRPEKNHVS
jgi:hypothetical protein